MNPLLQALLWNVNLPKLGSRRRRRRNTRRGRKTRGRSRRRSTPSVYRPSTNPFDEGGAFDNLEYDLGSLDWQLGGAGVPTAVDGTSYAIGGPDDPWNIGDESVDLTDYWESPTGYAARPAKRARTW